jgi:hypothetical protein
VEILFFQSKGQGHPTAWHEGTTREIRYSSTLYLTSVLESVQKILGPVYDNEKENWRILTDKETYSNVKTPAITETIRLHRLPWFGHVQRMEENRIPKRVLCIYIWNQQDREVDQEIDGKMK